MYFVNKPALLIVPVFLTMFTACTQSGELKSTADISLAEKERTPEASENKNYFMNTDTISAPELPAAGNNEQPKPQGTATSVQHIDWDKKIIKNAGLNVEAKNYKTFNDFVHQQVKQADGYVAGEEQSRSEYKIENIVTIKVPVDQFDNLVKAITSTKDDNVESQKVTSQDVTGEVIDTRSRTEAKRQVRLRYIELLKQAKNMEEILKVQQEINNIQEEIEAGAGRVTYLTHAAAYSTIQLTFYEILNAQAVQPDKPGFGLRVLAALGNGLTWVGEMLVLLLTLWPLWLCAGGVWWLVKRYRAKPKTSQ
jgi:hypothetical protein